MSFKEIVAKELLERGYKRQTRFVRIEDIRFPILEYKDNKIDAKELINKLEKLINKYEKNK